MPYKDKELKKIKDREYSKNNSVKITERSIKWRKENPKKYAEAKKKYIDSHRDEIRAYRRSYSLKNLYNISEEEYYKLFLEQNGCCAICGSCDPKGNKHSNHFQVDHDHITGKIRGLLCSRCNRGLGLLGDNIEVIEKVLIYLKGEYVNDPSA